MGALRIGPIAFLSICWAFPSGMGVSVQKEKNEAPSDCHHYRWGFTEHRVFDKAARMANSSFRTPHPRMPPFENRLLGPKSAFFRLWSKKVGEKFGGTNKKP